MTKTLGPLEAGMIRTSEHVMGVELEEFIVDLYDEGIPLTEVCELLQVFRQATPPLIADLRSAIDLKDSTVALSLAHTLKGSCASVGFREMAKGFGSLECSCRGRDWPDAQLALQAVSAAYQQAAELCRSVIEMHANPSLVENSLRENGTRGFRQLSTFIHAKNF